MFTASRQLHHGNGRLKRYRFRPEPANVFDRIEHNGEEIILHRNKHQIARIIPGASHLTATEAMADPYRRISDDAASSWI
jgi:antitoxin (DNA-binding transcriptional repressor) of toxin-antitoxin stability system